MSKLMCLGACIIAAVTGLPAPADVVPASQPTVTPLGLEELKLEALKAWGERHYRFVVRRPGEDPSELGTMTLKTTVDKDRVVLTTSMRLTVKGKAMSSDVVIDCKADSHLSIQGIASTGAGDDEFRTYKLQRGEGSKATVTEADRAGKPARRTIDLPLDIVAFESLPRIAAALPRTTGRSYQFNAMLDTTELQIKQDGYTLACVDRRDLEASGKTVPCTRYVVSEGDGQDGGRAFMEVFVADDAVVHKVIVDGRKEWLLTPR